MLTHTRGELRVCGTNLQGGQRQVPVVDGVVLGAVVDVRDLHRNSNSAGDRWATNARRQQVEAHRLDRVLARMRYAAPRGV
jgi:hypothetical protein